MFNLTIAANGFGANRVSDIDGERVAVSVTLNALGADS
jgi:hypothetical protein